MRISNIYVLRMLAALVIVLSLAIAVKHGPAAGGVAFFVSSAAVYSNYRRRPAAAYAWSGVALGDIFIPEVYNDIIPLNSLESTAFVSSGIAVTDPNLTTAAQSGARQVTVPMWNDLDHTVEENASTDDDTQATPGKVDSDELNARCGWFNKSFGSADLATELAKSTPGQGDPLTRIRERFGMYWNYRFGKRIMSILKGVMLDNIASDGGDMVKDISIADGNAANAANYINADALIDAIMSLGDRFMEISAIGMHSVIYTRLVKQNLITNVRDADGTLLYQTYLEKRVIVDDTMPVVAGATSGFVYTTVLFGSGVIGYGEGTPTVPSEVYRLPRSGNGGGTEEIVERKTWLLHPKGFNWTETSVTGGKSPNNVDLANPANWERIYERKRVPVSFLKTNG